MKTKYKHIEFREVSNPKRKTSRWAIWNHGTGDHLGEIQWDRGWRQYVYIIPGVGEYKFSRGCLSDISHFLQQLMDERKK